MKDSPCKGCQERFTACSDRCPKDLRGGYGHKAWLADYHKEEAQKKAWRKQKSDDAYRDERNGFVYKKRRNKGLVSTRDDTYLAWHFDKWWIALFGALFLTSVSWGDKDERKAD